jgi:hypothetical protein
MTTKGFTSRRRISLIFRCGGERPYCCKSWILAAKNIITSREDPYRVVSSLWTEIRSPLSTNKTLSVTRALCFLTTTASVLLQGYFYCRKMRATATSCSSFGKQKGFWEAWSRVPWLASLKIEVPKQVSKEMSDIMLRGVDVSCCTRTNGFLSRSWSKKNLAPDKQEFKRSIAK